MKRFLRLFATTLIFCTVYVSFARDTTCSDCLGLTPDQIAAYPTPPVTQLAPNETLMYDRRYDRVLDAVTIYDAPNGNPVRTLDKGFNFVTTQGAQDDWTQINPDEWVQTQYLSDVLPSRFAEIVLPETDLTYPVAWILVNVVPSRTPGTDPTPGDLAILRYTVVNIYATIQVGDWNWYQVGIDQWVDQRQIARVTPIARPTDVDTDKWVAVDLYEQIAVAYENDKPVFATLVASGLADWPTNEGLFHIYARFPRTIMSGAQGNPDFYFLEEVPWTMYFDHDIALHGTYWHDGFGYRHSHGCVNLSITDSAWLYNWSSSEIDLSVPDDTGAAVYVYSSGTYR